MQVEDDRPVRKLGHEIGQDLSTLSVDELMERIDVLRREIERLESAAAAKSDTRAAADAFFKL